MYATHHGKQSTRIATSEQWEDLIDTLGYKALIFDCDGTLVESGQAHYNSFRDALRAQGAELDSCWYQERTGLDRHSLLTEFAKTAHPGFDVERARALSFSAFETHVHLVRSIPETSKLLSRFSSELPVAVGTNAEAEIAKASLTSTGLISSIRVIVSISDSLRPKPCPDIFSAAAIKLDCPPEAILVIEDSEQGVQAAKLAGMDVLALKP